MNREEIKTNYVIKTPLSKKFRRVGVSQIFTLTISFKYVFCFAVFFYSLHLMTRQY